MIIKVIHLPGGATVCIHDDYIAEPGSEEERRVIEAQNRAAREIMKSVKEGR